MGITDILLTSCLIRPITCTDVSLTGLLMPSGKQVFFQFAV